MIKQSSALYDAKLTKRPENILVDTSKMIPPKCFRSTTEMDGLLQVCFDELFHMYPVDRV